jgi:hypothetical protein
MVRAVVTVVAALTLMGLGAFMAIIDPRHGSEIVGYPLLAVGAGLGVSLVVRLRRQDE